MFAVIFRAEVKQLDASYAQFAERLRELAKTRYGCLDFISLSEGDREIAVSYWDSLEQIAAWKKDPDHRAAQEKGRKDWYRSYQVQVVEVVREYKSAS